MRAKIFENEREKIRKFKNRKAAETEMQEDRWMVSLRIVLGAPLRAMSWGALASGIVSALAGGEGLRKLF